MSCMVLTCISLVTNDAENLVMCLWGITCIIILSSFVKCLIKSFAHFSNRMVYLLVTEFEAFFAYSGYKSLVRYTLCLFSLSRGLPFHFLDCFLLRL